MITGIHSIRRSTSELIGMKSLGVAQVVITGILMNLIQALYVANAIQKTDCYPKNFITKSGVRLKKNILPEAMVANTNG